MTAAIRQLGKEYRALAPAWLAAAAVIGASALHIPYLSSFALPAYFVGAVSVGALSFGHEYTSRALPLLLAARLPSLPSRIPPRAPQSS